MLLFFLLVSLLSALYCSERRAFFFLLSSDSAFFLLAALLLLLYSQFFSFAREQWRLRGFRGPLAIPIVGNCYQPSLNMRSLLRYLAELRRSYGKIFTLHLFSKAYLVVLDPVLVRRVLSDNKTFVTDTEVCSAFSGIFGNRLLYSEVHTPRQRDVKNIVRRVLARRNVARNLPVLNSLAAQSVRDLIAEKLQWMQNFSEDAFTVHVDQFFTLIALRVLLNVTLKTDFRATPEKERHACREVHRAGHLLQYLLSLTHLLPRWLLWPVHWILGFWRRAHYDEVAKKIKVQMKLREEKFAAELSSEINESVKEARHDFEGGSDDFLCAIDRGELTIQEVAEHMIALCGAGQESSCYFASFACLLLAQNPEKQDKLRATIIEQLGDREEVTADDLTQLVYLQQVLQEVLRLYTIVPTALRKSKRDVTVKDCSLSDNSTHWTSQNPASPDSAQARGANDITIPAGTNILIPFYLMNRDPSVWPEPAAFKPERFEQKWGLGIGREHGCSLGDASADYSNARAGFYPFGYGNRTCIGAAMVQAEVSVMLCHLLRRVVLSPDPTFQCTISAATLLTPTNGVQVRMKVIRDETPLDSLLR
jgi:cytochrome P450